MAGALERITVLDLSQNWAAPGAAMYLADQGANVIKVEPPGGDASRGWGVHPMLHGTAKGFLAVNRNKRSITVDLTKPEGRAVVHDLVRTADVAIVNLRPAAAARIGIDYETLSAINPRIVYGVVLGYGEKGPYAGRPAYDGVAAGMSGAAERSLPDGTPIRPGLLIADCSAPMLLAFGITTALLQREHTGRGGKVETSLLAAAIAMQSTGFVSMPGEGIPRTDSDLAAGSIRCADGRYISVLALTERQFISLVEVLGLDHILSSPEFLAEDRNILVVNQLFRNEIRDAYLKRPADEWLQLLMDADIPCGPVLTRDEVVHFDQVTANEYIVPVDYPDVGEITVVGVPVQLTDYPGAVRMRPPLLGEHTDEIAAGMGYDAEKIAALRASGALY